MAYLELLGAQIAIGAAAIFARFALTGAGPIAVAALRMCIGAVPMLVIASMSGPERIGWKREVAFVSAGVLLAVYVETWIASLQFTSVAVATLLVTTVPLFTETYDAIRLRQLPSSRLLVAFALAAAGVWLITRSKSTQAPIAGDSSLGIVLALSGAVAFAAYLVIVRTASTRGGEETMRTSAIVARTFTWSAIVLIGASVWSGQGAPKFSNHTSWFGIVCMGLVSQLLGHTGINAALKSFSPTVISTTTLLEPVAAAVLAAIIFGETLYPDVIAGGVFVLSAVALALSDAPALAGRT